MLATNALDNLLLEQFGYSKLVRYISSTDKRSAVQLSLDPNIGNSSDGKILMALIVMNGCARYSSNGANAFDYEDFISNPPTHYHSSTILDNEKSLPIELENSFIEKFAREAQSRMKAAKDIERHLSSSASHPIYDGQLSRSGQKEALRKLFDFGPDIPF